AFILGLPANEIVLPVLLMGYLAAGTMAQASATAPQDLLLANGWTWLTVLNTMLFSLLHYPCGTTLLTIWKETGSRRWTAVAVLLPTLVALTVCFVTALGARVLRLV
ncbi:MAG TPA: iron transporter FeoB, partial [Peptococcaceae bacterium]|nr:iron transporter FeoB [Peptococcaceae bacterium]